MPFPPQQPEIDPEDGFQPQAMEMLGGVNLLLDPRKIRDDELVLSKNAYPVTPGVMSKRLGVNFLEYLNVSSLDASPTLYPKSTISPSWSGPIDFVTCFVDGTNNFLLFAADITGQNLLGAIVQQCNPDTKPWMFSFGTEIIVLLGQNGGMFNNVSAYIPNQGIVVSTLGNITTGTSIISGNEVEFRTLGLNCVNDFSPKVGCAYRSRVVYANLGPGYENYILFSDNFNPTQVVINQGDDALAANGRALRIGRSGDIIVGVTEIMQTAVGSPSQSALLVLCQNSAYIITGEPNQCSDQQALIPVTGNLVVSKVSYDCGCASPWTIESTPYGTIWAGPDDVWLYQYGTVPLRIGSKIRPALLNTPPASRYKMSGIYANGLYRLSTASAGQNPSNTDPLGDVWLLDLRNGAPTGDPGENLAAENAQWFGPQQYITGATGATGAPVLVQGVTNFWRDKRPGRNDQIVYGIEAGLSNYGGATAAYPSVLQYDSPNDHDIFYNPILDDNPGVGGLGATFAKENIDTSFLSDVRGRRFDNGAARLQKIIDGVEFDIGSSIMMQLNADIIMDGGLQTDTQSLAISDIIDSTGDTDLYLGSGSLDTQALSDASQGRVVRNYGTRDIAYTYQIRIYDSAGISIQADNNTFLMSLGTGQKIQVTIPIGQYANLPSLVQQIQNSIQSATNNGWSNNQQANPRTSAYPSISAPGGTTWTVDFDGTYGASVALQISASKLFSLLGFSTNTSPAKAQTQSAESSVTAGTALPPWFGQNAIFTLTDVKANYQVIPRGPT